MNAARHHMPLVAREPTEGTRGPHGYRVLSGHGLEPNIFFEPAILEPAFAYLAPRETGHCTAYDAVSSLSIGSMPVLREIGRYGPFPTPKPLSVWQHPYAVNGTPLLDADQPDAALNGLLDAAATRDDGPPVLRMPMVHADGPLWECLMAVLKARGLRYAITHEVKRAGLRIDDPADASLRQVQSKGSNHSVRRARARLEQIGELELLCARTLPTLSRALDTFLDLEASGWKGERGTALKTIGHDGFFRTAIMNLGINRAARIYTTVFDGKVIAATVWIRSGGADAPVWSPWKTAYDESMRPYAPGTINLHEATADLLALAADEGKPFHLDSLAGPESIIAGRLWPHPRRFADLLIDLDPSGSVAYRTTLVAETTRVRAKTVAKSALQSVRGLGSR